MSLGIGEVVAASVVNGEPLSEILKGKESYHLGVLLSDKFLQFHTNYAIITGNQKDGEIYAKCH